MESKDIKKWLAKDLDCSTSYINSLYDSSLAINFLLVWNRFEVILFSKKCNFRDIDNFDIEKMNSCIFSELKEMN